MKKTWIGVDTVTFFGYEVTGGKWKLSDARKDAVSKMPFPANVKEMQSFLGAALFFHHHIPNYSSWAAKLYEMIHKDFNWDSNTWTFGYHAHFELFKKALLDAQTLHFPDYSLDWVLFTDASDKAIGGALAQKRSVNGIDTYEFIGFCSEKLSSSALNWDVYKKEAYGIYKSVMSFSYYLRGKHFTLYTDHRNLQWMEASQSPIIVRWRVLLQSYSFIIHHISGSKNSLADYLSRMGEFKLLSEEEGGSDSAILFAEIMRQVHGGRSLHYGAYNTWSRAKSFFPEAHISIEEVRNYVKECPICQKTRATGIKGLTEEVRVLKPASYRKAIGIDHVAVTPEDKNGNKVAILIVEHWSHFPQAYPAKDYSAETVATVLFKHFCTFGVFDYLISDPGSSFMSEVVCDLNKHLGVQHRVSLVGRHQSNGCEATGREFLRHLRTLVLDERLVDKWSDDTVLPLINFALCSYPSSETGGFTPFQLKYGTC
jgi:hypothetical protein